MFASMAVLIGCESIGKIVGLFICLGQYALGICDSTVVFDLLGIAKRLPVIRNSIFQFPCSLLMEPREMYTLDLCPSVCIPCRRSMTRFTRSKASSWRWRPVNASIFAHHGDGWISDLIRLRRGKLDSFIQRSQRFLVAVKSDWPCPNTLA